MRALIVVALLAGTAAAEKVYVAEAPPDQPVTTYLVNDEAFGEIISHGRWSFWSAGLGLTHVVVGHVELGLEGSVMRLDSAEPDDKRHGFALRAEGTLGYRMQVSHLAGIDFGVEPQAGVATAAVFTMGSASQYEVFGGIRGSFRFQFDHGPSQHFGEARALGGHVTLRVSRAEHHLAAAFLLGYDWGL